MSTPTIDKGYGFDAIWTVYGSGRTIEDLTGASAKWVIARNREAETALIEKTSGGGVTIQIADGTVSLTLTQAETESLAPGAHYHQLSLTLPGRDARIYFSGSIDVVNRI